MKVKIIVTTDERIQIVAALFRFGLPVLADRIFKETTGDTANDGPEVDILRTKPEGWDG